MLKDFQRILKLTLLSIASSVVLFSCANPDGLVSNQITTDPSPTPTPTPTPTPLAEIDMGTNFIQLPVVDPLLTPLLSAGVVIADYTNPCATDVCAINIRPQLITEFGSANALNTLIEEAQTDADLADKEIIITFNSGEVVIRFGDLLQEVNSEYVLKNFIVFMQNTWFAVSNYNMPEKEFTFSMVPNIAVPSLLSDSSFIIAGGKIGTSSIKHIFKIIPDEVANLPTLFPNNTAPAYGYNALKYTSNSASLSISKKVDFLGVFTYPTDIITAGLDDDNDIVVKSTLAGSTFECYVELTTGISFASGAATTYCVP